MTAAQEAAARVAEYLAARKTLPWPPDRVVAWTTTKDHREHLLLDSDLRLLIEGQS